MWGLLIGDGHFGHDGRVPVIVVKMHIRHEPLLRWARRHIPGSHLHGPYESKGRRFHVWMVRGRPLRDHLIPLLDRLPFRELDPHAYGGYLKMKALCGIQPSPIDAAPE